MSEDIKNCPYCGKPASAAGERGQGDLRKDKNG